MNWDDVARELAVSGAEARLMKLAVDPSQLLLVSGHSGAGKSTAAARLAELLGRPLMSIDDYPGFREFFQNDPENKHLELRTGSPERKAYKDLARRAATDTLANASGPAVIEGGQLSYLRAKTLAQYPNRVFIHTPAEQLFQQRLERVRQKQIAKGREWTPELAARRDATARKIYRSNVGSMNRFRQLPGTVTHGSRDPLEPLLGLAGEKAAGLAETAAGWREGVERLGLPVGALAGAAGGLGLGLATGGWRRAGILGPIGGLLGGATGYGVSQAPARADGAGLGDHAGAATALAALLGAAGTAVNVHRAGNFVDDIETHPDEPLISRKRMKRVDGRSFPGRLLPKSLHSRLYGEKTPGDRKDDEQAEKAADLADGVTLQPHQERVRRKVQDQLDQTGRSRLFLYHSLGSGKTLSGLASADATGMPYTAIVPAALRDNLRKEQAKFLDPETAPSGDVISQTAIGMGKPVPKSHSLIVDETHRLRNPETAQTRRFLNLADKAEQVTMLSGTPVINDPGDFAVPYQVLTGKKTTPDEFLGRYVNEDPETPSWFGRLLGRKAEGPGLSRVDELKKELAGKIDYHAPTAPKAEVTEENVPVVMNKEQARLYRGMYGKLPWLLRYKMEHDYHMSKGDLSRLTSFMTGPRQVGLSTLPFMRENRDPAKAFDTSPKLQAAFSKLQEHLAQNPDGKALVFSNFIEAGLTPYQQALERAGIPAASFTGKLNDAQRKKLVDDYNSNKLRVALLGPAGTEGLSFKGTRLVQMLDPHWNEARGRQSVGRGLRFDSHDHLPEDQRKVQVQRFMAQLPPEGLARYKGLVGLTPKPERAADDYLALRARRKEEVNQKFMDLLKEIGSAAK